MKYTDFSHATRPHHSLLHHHINSKPNKTHTNFRSIDGIINIFTMVGRMQTVDHKNLTHFVNYVRGLCVCRLRTHSPIAMAINHPIAACVWCVLKQCVVVMIRFHRIQSLRGFSQTKKKYCVPNVFLFLSFMCNVLFNFSHTILNKNRTHNIFLSWAFFMAAHQTFSNEPIFKSI